MNDERGYLREQEWTRFSQQFHPLATEITCLVKHHNITNNGTLAHLSDYSGLAMR